MSFSSLHAKPATARPIRKTIPKKSWMYIMVQMHLLKFEQSLIVRCHSKCRPGKHPQKHHKQLLRNKLVDFHLTEIWIFKKNPTKGAIFFKIWAIHELVPERKTKPFHFFFEKKSNCKWLTSANSCWHKIFKLTLRFSYFQVKTKIEFESVNYKCLICKELKTGI